MDELTRAQQTVEKLFDEILDDYPRLRKLTPNDKVLIRKIFHERAMTNETYRDACHTLAMRLVFQELRAQKRRQEMRIIEK